jgi:hypothetical protein
MKNLTNRSSAIALCAIAALSFLAPATQAGSSPFQSQIAIDERGAKPVPIGQPGGDPVSNPGGGSIRSKRNPINIKPVTTLPPVKAR